MVERDLKAKGLKDKKRLKENENDKKVDEKKTKESDQVVESNVNSENKSVQKKNQKVN